MELAYRLLIVKGSRCNKKNLKTSEAAAPVNVGYAY